MDKNKCLNGWAFRWAEKQAQKGNMSVQMRAFCIMLVEIYSIYTKIRLSLKIARLERKVYKIEKRQAKLAKRDEKLKEKNAKAGSQPDNVKCQFTSDVDLQKNRMLFTWCNRAFIALALYIPFCEAFGFTLGNLRFCIIKCLYFVYAVLVLMFPLCVSKETEEKDKMFYILEIGVGLLFISLELAVALFFAM